MVNDETLRAVGEGLVSRDEVNYFAPDYTQGRRLICPACLGTKFRDGPSGGMSINIECECGCRYNWCAEMNVLEPINTDAEIAVIRTIYERKAEARQKSLNDWHRERTQKVFDRWIFRIVTAMSVGLFFWFIVWLIQSNWRFI